MVQYPETQKRAQDEIDRAIGPGRLPGLSDRSNLHYVDAIVTEVARLRPPIPIRMCPSLAPAFDILFTSLTSTTSGRARRGLQWLLDRG